MEVVGAVERLGGLGEPLHLVGQGVVASGFAGDVTDLVVDALVRHVPPRGNDLRIVVAEDLVVIPVGEFVEHHPRLAFGPVEERLGVTDLDRAFLVRVVAVGNQPVLRDVVAHAGGLMHVELDPDLNLPEPSERGLRKDPGDHVELVIEFLERRREQGRIFLGDRGIYPDRPSSDAAGVVFGGRRGGCRRAGWIDQRGRAAAAGRRGVGQNECGDGENGDCEHAHDAIVP